MALYMGHATCPSARAPKAPAAATSYLDPEPNIGHDVIKSKSRRASRTRQTGLGDCTFTLLNSHAIPCDTDSSSSSSTHFCKLTSGLRSQ